MSLKPFMEASNGLGDEVTRTAIQHPINTNGKGHKDPDPLAVLARVDGEIQKFGNLQDRVVALRGASHELRQDLNCYRKQVQHCDAEILKYHYKTRGDSTVDPDHLARLFEAAQQARDKLGPLEDECERTELEIGTTEFQLLDQSRKIRKRVKESGVNLLLNLHSGGFSDNSSSSDDSSSTFLPDSAWEYDGSSDGGEQNGLPYYTRSEAELIIQEQAQRNSDYPPSMKSIGDSHQDHDNNAGGREQNELPCLTRSEVEMQIQEESEMQTKEKPQINGEDPAYLNMSLITTNAPEHKNPEGKNGLEGMNGLEGKNGLEFKNSLEVENGSPIETDLRDQNGHAATKGHANQNGHSDENGHEEGQVPELHGTSANGEASKKSDPGKGTISEQSDSANVGIFKHSDSTTEALNDIPRRTQPYEKSVVDGHPQTVAMAMVFPNKIAQPVQNMNRHTPNLQPPSPTANLGSPSPTISDSPPSEPRYPSHDFSISESPWVSDWMLNQLRASRWQQMVYKDYASQYGVHGKIKFKSKKFSRIWRADQAQSEFTAPRTILPLRERRSRTSIIATDDN